MSNEVATDFDILYLNFIEDNKMQIWYDRYSKTWTVQCPKPFKQVSHEKLKGAITKMAFQLGHLKLTQ